MTVRIIDPTTGEAREVAGEEAEQAFRGGQAQLVPGTRIPLEDEFGKFAGYTEAENAQEVLQNAGLRFASARALAAHEAEQAPIQAFAEGFANEVLVPGLLDLPAQAAGADMAALAARRETMPGKIGQALGFGASMINPLTAGGRVATSAAGKVISHAATGAALDGVTKAASKYADDALLGVVTNDASRAVTAQALGTATVGAGIGALGVLDEAALGNTEASAEMILAGMGAGGFIGAIGGGVAGRLGAGKVKASVGPDGQALAPEEAAAALRAQGVEVSDEGWGKWSARLYAKATAKATGAREEDILKVLSPAGRKIVVEGEKARDEAVRSVSDLVDRLEAHGSQFDLTQARVSETALAGIPKGAGPAALQSVAEGFGDARAVLGDMVKNATNYGMTPEQMTARLRPIGERIAAAEARVSKAAAVAPTPADVPRAGGTVYISTPTLDPAEVLSGKLSSVKGATTDIKKVRTFAEGRYIVAAPKQGTPVRYDNPDQAFEDGMAIMRRVVGESLGVGSKADNQTATKLLNDVDWGPELRKLGPMPKLDGSRYNSPDELADAVLEHWGRKQADAGLRTSEKAAKVKPKTESPDDAFLRSVFESASGDSQYGPGMNRGFISDIVAKSGLPVEQVHKRLAKLQEKGKLVLYASDGPEGDLLPEQLAAGMPGPAGGRPRTFVRLDPAASKALAGKYTPAAGATPAGLPDRQWVADKIRGSAKQWMERFQDESELVTPDGLQLGPGTKILDTQTRRWLTPKEFAKREGVNLPSELEEAAGKGLPVDDAAVREAYRELDQVYRVLAAQERKIKPLIPETEGLSAASRALAHRLQDDTVFGGAAAAHRELTETAERMAAARDKVDSLLRFEGGKVDRARVKAFTKNLDKVQGDAGVDALAEWVRATRSMGEATGKHLRGLEGYDAAAKQIGAEFDAVYKRMSDDVLTLNAQDRLLQVSRDQGVVPGFAVAGALSAVGLGAAVPAAYAATNAILNPGRAARAVASMMTFKEQVAAGIKSRVHNLFNNYGPPVRASAVAATLPKLTQVMMGGSPSERREAYLEHRAELEAMSDPATYMSVVAPQLAEFGQDLPAHAAALAAKGPALAGIVEAYRPAPLSASQPTPSQFYHHASQAAAEKAYRGEPKPRPQDLPADEDIRQYGMVLAIASSPGVVLDWAKSGQLRKSHVQALQAMYPHMYSMMHAQMIGAASDAAERGKRLSPVAARALDLFMNPGPPLPADVARMAQQQLMYEEERKIAEMAGGGPAKGPKKPKSADMAPTSDHHQSFPF